MYMICTLTIADHIWSILAWQTQTSFWPYKCQVPFALTIVKSFLIWQTLRAIPFSKCRVLKIFGASTPTLRISWTLYPHIFTPQLLRLEGYWCCLVRRSGSVRDFVNAITLHKLHVSSCILYSGVLHIKILDDFDVDLCVTFLNFQTCSKSGCIVNMITPQQLHASCNFTEIFFTSKSLTSSMLPFVWPFELGHV